MRTVSFPRGIHPPEMKSATERAEIERCPLPAHAVILMQQHAGAPCKPLVERGEEVKAGQKIGDSDAFISAPVHASVSGKVTAVEERRHPLGIRVLSAVIESDGRDDWVELSPRDPDSVSGEELVRSLREAGLVGLGGAAFPSSVKLSPPEGKTIDTLILNGAECEPYLTADDRLMCEHPGQIVKGARMLGRALKARRIVIAIEENKPHAVQAVAGACREEPRVELVKLKTKYPQGGEKQLILAVLDREVPSGGLPMDAGVVVHNVGTVFAAWEAVSGGKPLVERVLSVTGPGIATPKNLRVRIGTPVSDLLSLCGARVEEGTKVIIGGPMMGLAQYDLDIPVVKGTSGVVVLPPEMAMEAGRMPCIQCGTCVDGCPIGLVPTTLAHLSSRGDFEAAGAINLADCIECGCCAYDCPSAIPLAQMIKLGKLELARRKRAGGGAS